MPGETFSLVSPSSHNALWLNHQMDLIVFVFQGSSYFCLSKLCKCSIALQSKCQHGPPQASLHYFSITQTILLKWLGQLYYIHEFFKGFLIIFPAVLSTQPLNRKQISKINFTTGYSSSCISQKPKNNGMFLYIQQESFKRELLDINILNCDHARHCNHSFILREKTLKTAF